MKRQQSFVSMLSSIQTRKIRKALIVATSTTTIPNQRAIAGSPPITTGYSLPDVLYPFMIFHQSGVDVEIASIEGGKLLCDPTTEHFLQEDTDLNMAFQTNNELRRQLNNATPLLHYSQPSRTSDIDLILFAGGYGCMWDFPFHSDVAELGRKIYEDNGGIVATIGHGGSALLNMTLSGGNLLVYNKHCTATSNEEEFNNLRVSLYPKHTVDERSTLEDLLVIKSNGNYSKGDMFSIHSVIDGRLWTAQNGNSAKQLSELLMKL
jgi:putative intracellular protease/amidase